jgi:hypothetical protein
MKVVRLSALLAGHLYPPGNIQILLERKIPAKLSGMEPVTFRFEEQLLNQKRHRATPHAVFENKVLRCLSQTGS